MRHGLLGSPALIRRSWLATPAVLALAGGLLGSTGAANAVTAADTAYPFRNPKLPMTQRIDDLMQRLTLDEKIGLMHQYQQPVPRLGIGIFKAGTEALHGMAWSNDHRTGGSVVTATATQFPQAVGLASTWDPGLVKRVGSAVGDEARGLNDQDPEVWGLNLWAPVVNPLRDPRWGRNEEGYSEDPLLTGAISTAYGSGLEGDDPKYLKTAPTLKHFAGYNNEERRDVTSSNLTPRVMHEYEERSFRPALESNAATGVMASYNLVNGRPATVNPMLNELRSWSDRPLFNVSDAFAPINLTGSQGYFDTQAEADAAMFKAGIDGYISDGADPGAMVKAVKEALAKGLLTIPDIEKVDRNALSIRFRLGEFDPDGGPYGKLTPAEVNAPDHQRLARQAAGESMVLLKNDRQALPLKANQLDDVAVIGPLAKAAYGDFYGGKAPYTVTPAAGIQERLGAGASVATVEGVDRIALRDTKSGKYVTATGTGETDAVAASAAKPAEAAQFDVFDWGEGIVTLRNVANGNVVGSTGSALVTKDSQPNGWFVQQQFVVEDQPDGTVALRYAGYETKESWYGGGTYVTVGADGRLGVTAHTAAEAAHFDRAIIRSGVDDAVAAAAKADTAVLVVGSMPFINGREAHDRTSMALAAGQRRLVEAVLKANPHTVLVLETSYPQTISWAQQRVPAIVWTTHAGQETGHALADVLFGDRNPSGRLTQTWYQSERDLASIHDYDIVKTGTTYLYHSGRDLYPFGHGLSYTSFRYSPPTASANSIDPDGHITVTVKVTNTGSRAGDEVVQLYGHQEKSSMRQPVKQLLAFEKVHLRAGESRQVHLRVEASKLALWDVSRGRWVVENATHQLMVGASSTDIRGTVRVHVQGESVPARDLSRTTEGMNFDDYAGVELVDTSKEAGTSITAPEGGWALFRRADLRHSPKTFAARVALAAGGSSTIELRSGSPTGRLLGTLTVPSTGGVYDYRTLSTNVAIARGVEDVYIKLGQGVRLATFSLK